MDMKFKYIWKKSRSRQARWQKYQTQQLPTIAEANKKVFVFKSTEPPTNLKRIKNKVKTKTSDSVIMVMLKCQDPDVPDQPQHWPIESSAQDKKSE